ncbi:hypothetical protein CFC21_082305 [Triticum aestivum]|uniref:Uncharacterized protein n=2 Tax=Triticum aestivum TaxID=4565 RepID=A0A3B6NLC9_WHEAT|nr:hypothetical protein CFC21_082305 [Triticum aestivum]
MPSPPARRPELAPPRPVATAQAAKPVKGRGGSVKRPANRRRNPADISTRPVKVSKAAAAVRGNDSQTVRPAASSSSHTSIPPPPPPPPPAVEEDVATPTATASNMFDEMSQRPSIEIEDALTKSGASLWVFACSQAPMLRTAIAAAPRPRISLAPARFAHELAQAQAQPAVPGRDDLDPSWAPLYRRISRLYGRPPGMMAAEMDNYLRKRRPLSADQIVAYVRKLRKFKSNACALEVSPYPPISPQNGGLIWIGMRICAESSRFGIKRVARKGDGLTY